MDIAFTAAENCSRDVVKSRGVLDSVSDIDAAAFDKVAEGGRKKSCLILQSIPGGGEAKRPLLE